MQSVSACDASSLSPSVFFQGRGQAPGMWAAILDNARDTVVCVGSHDQVVASNSLLITRKHLRPNLGPLVRRPANRRTLGL